MSIVGPDNPLNVEMYLCLRELTARTPITWRGVRRRLCKALGLTPQELATTYPHAERQWREWSHRSLNGLSVTGEPATF